ncbi:MAG: HipA domain-containing protein [Bacilli bacterium]|nr:HipA domain-containing protein [Bacilli bacterium]
MRIDFSKCKSSGITYGGMEEKKGIIFCNKKYMLKFRRHEALGDYFNDISEYIGSRVFESIGIECQKTILGKYKNEYVVACLDFVKDFNFTPFNDVGESSLDDGKTYGYSYEEIEEMILKNRKLVNKEEALNKFWETYIVDALLANGDRHGRNWGYKKIDNKYYVCPVFDNGSCLFCGMLDESEMRLIVKGDQDEINERVYQTPLSIIKNSNNRKSDYFTIINSLKYKKCNEALLKIFPKINLKEIEKVVLSTDITNLRKQFLIRMIKERYEKILKPAFLKLGGKYGKQKK